jgi:hypothetical protein
MSSSNGNMYKTYGTSTTYSNGRTSFKEFETDDLDVLKQTFIQLDRQYGHENLKVVTELDFSIDVDIFQLEQAPIVNVPTEDTTKISDDNGNNTNVNDDVDSVKNNTKNEEEKNDEIDNGDEDNVGGSSESDEKSDE